jgi:F5/8 type C domain/Putative Ig domain
MVQRPDRAATSSARPVDLPRPFTAAFVKLEALSEWNGNTWSSMAEFNLLDATGATVDRAGWTASADSSGEHDSPANAIDSDPKTLWHTQWAGEAGAPLPHAFVVDLGGTRRLTGFRYLGRQDQVVNGTIAKYRFYVSEDGVHWGDPVASGDFSQISAPSVEKTILFAEQTSNHSPTVRAPAQMDTAMGATVSMRLDARDEDGDHLRYSASGLPPGLMIAPESGVIWGTPVAAGSYVAMVTVNDGKGPSVSASWEWSVHASVTRDEAAKTANGESRFVKLEEISSVDGKPWASVAEFNLLGIDGATLSRKGWVASADSAETSDRPSNAIDGDPASLWHTQWYGASPPPPHSLIVDLGRSAAVSGFRYLPRQDSVSNGSIARFRFYVSNDGVSWGRPIAEGDFTKMGPALSEKTVLFNSANQTR